MFTAKAIALDVVNASANEIFAFHDGVTDVYVVLIFCPDLD